MQRYHINEKQSNKCNRLELKYLFGRSSVCLSFDSLTKKILSYLHSTCGCYDGRNECSHMSALIMFIGRAQCCDKNSDKFEKTFPESPLKSQNCLTLIENVVSTKEHAKDKKKELENKKLAGEEDLL